MTFIDEKVLLQGSGAEAPDDDIWSMDMRFSNHHTKDSSLSLNNSKEEASNSVTNPR